MLSNKSVHYQSPSYDYYGKLEEPENVSVDAKIEYLSVLVV